MSNWQQGPDYRALAMAEFLDQLDRTHSVSLPENIRRYATDVINWKRALNGERERIANLRAQRQAEIDAILAGDQPLVGKQQCDVRVDHPHTFHASRCSNAARWLRRWTTREFVGTFYAGQPTVVEDGQYVLPGEWVIGKGFTNRPMTEAEQARIERRFAETEHTAKLCSTHRKQQGEHGLPRL